MGHRHKYKAGPDVAAKDAAIKVARLKLSEQEQQEFKRIVKHCVNKAHARGVKDFGAAAARELFGKLLVWDVLREQK